MPTTNDIKDYIYGWNIRFPIDRWWRTKHKIPMFSEEHRASCFIDQLIEFHEDRIFMKLNEDNGSKKKYHPGTGDWLNIREISQQEIDDAFDRIKI